MEARLLKERYSMERHAESGAFLERHYPHAGPGRAASGSIYYYVAAGERTEFHVIDCDEYWCYNAGAALELWQVDGQGRLTRLRLGTEEGCEPTVYLPKGVCFASRSLRADGDGTFLTCITVPRFAYAGFRLLSREEITALCPETEPFFAAAPADPGKPAEALSNREKSSTIQKNDSSGGKP